MEENKMLEKIWREAQAVEVPQELSPERMKERIEAKEKEGAMKKKSEARQEGRKGFRWHGYGSWVAAAGVVLTLSLWAYGVAGRQALYEPGAEHESDEADGFASSGREETPGQQEPNETNTVQPDDKVAAVDGADESGQEEPPVKQLGNYHLAESYEEVYRMAADMRSEGAYDFSKGEMAGDGAAADAVPRDAVTAESERYNSAEKEAAGSQKKMEQASQKEDFSTTNLQVTGVDESDIVKTDGKNIYIAADDQVRIVDVTTGVPRQLGSIKPQLDGNMDRILEMYVSDDRMVLVVQTEETQEVPVPDTAALKGYSAEDMACGYGYDYGRLRTKALVYDITIPAGAKLVGAYEQDGGYNSSRKIGNMLYLFTDYGFSYGMSCEGQRLFGEESEEGETEIRLPQVQGKTIPENCIYLPKEGASCGVVISAMDITNPTEVKDQKFIWSGSAELYVTGKSIYLYEATYDAASDRQRTGFVRFRIGDGKIKADCAEAVPGRIEDTFALHETADGYLYVLTTDFRNSGTKNQLYVLDDKLKIYGKIEHIADGETVYAARFVDDIGYFVTYRNMDPLFTVDFSDPKNPTLIGELEIPGFSDYLQFWDDGYLIGVGEERKETDSEFIGIKVSLYDISDPTDVKEASKIVIDDAWGSPAKDNYKALLADRSKNVIAFLTDDKSIGADYTVSQHVFQVQDGKLVQVAKEKLEEGFEAYASRNLYIGDNLYVATERKVAVYDMKDSFRRTHMLDLI